MLVKKFLRVLESPRIFLSLLTILLLVIIIYLARKELKDAWDLLGQTNLAIMLLLIPLQIMVYYASGEMIFSYLRRSEIMKHISRFEQTRIALELNLVNHIFPSGGVSGISYATWRLHKLGVGSAQATFAQVVRYVMGFLAFVALLIISVLFLTIDGQINRYIVAASFLLVLLVIGMTSLVVFVFSSNTRMNKMAIFSTKMINGLMRRLTLGRRKQILSAGKVNRFFIDMHSDFKELAANRNLLTKPFIWGVIFTIFDVTMFITAFWALGQSVNPAVLMVAYGVAVMTSLVALTPGGAGIYELIMIFFLTIAGVSADVAIAGIILTRAILLTGTIVFGYIFYQHALLKYGKKSDTVI